MIYIRDGRQKTCPPPASHKAAALAAAGRGMPPQQGRRNKGGTGARAPPQYLELAVVVPLQCFQQIWGHTKWVPPQYLAPSYGPGI